MKRIGELLCKYGWHKVSTWFEYNHNQNMKYCKRCKKVIGFAVINRDT